MTFGLTTAGSPPAAAGEGLRRYVIWSPQGLPARTGKEIEKIDGTRATPVIMGLDWLMRSYDRAGNKIDDLPEGYGYPFEMTVVNPAAYKRFVPADQAEVVARLEPGQALISRSEAKLRDHDGPLRLGLRSGGVNAVAVVSDAVTNGYEAIMAAPAPDWKYRMRYFLVQTPATTSRDELREAVARVAGDIPLGLRSNTQVPHLRYAPGVRPQVAFKRAFGEFPARPASSGSLSILGRWVSRHIRTESVPVLGRVTCHRKFFAQLREAFEELNRRGLGHLVREYSGCYNARFVATPAGIRLSRHTWGIAFDINSSNNQFGAEPRQDPRLVKIMRDHGMVWGGDWVVPDGMHFEWDRLPEPH